MSTSETYDYSELTKDLAPVGDNMMTMLVALADQQLEIEAEIARLQELLEKANDELKRLSQVEIPRLLDGVEGKFKLPNGKSITVGEEIRVSVTKEKNFLAMKWLEDNNNGSLIKRKFTIEFNKDQEQWAKDFEKSLAETKLPLSVKKDKSVHHATMTAFIKERLANGEPVPLDIITVFRQRFSKIK